MKAVWRVTLDGQDLGAALRPRLSSLTIAEKRGEAADQLDLVLTDHDGKLALPSRGQRLSVALGWPAAGSGGRIPGLVPKGSFKIDEVEFSGAPDIVTVRARSADFTADFRVRRDQVWRDTTLGAVLSDIAGRQGLSPQLDPGLSAAAVPLLEQHGESDGSLLKRLGRKYDAVATVKAGALIFTPIGRRQTATAKALPLIKVTRADGDRHRWSVADRDKYTGVTANWHDVATARKKSVSAGDSHSAKRIRRTFATEADAQAYAAAEWGRIQRGEATFDYTLAIGRPDAFPECGFRITGLKPEIDAVEWVIDEATHVFDGSGGLTTSLRLETKL